MNGVVVHEGVRAAAIIDKIIELGGVAMQFAQVERGTGNLRGDPESDTDHTVMLGFVSVALAEYDPRLDRGKVALYTLVHDLPEVYAGDVRTTHQERVDFLAKQRAERDAVRRLDGQFGRTFPGFMQIIKDYEAQKDLESTYVKTLDKSMPALSHLFNDCITVLHEFDSVVAVRENSRKHTEKLISSYGAKHPLVIAVRQLISARFVTEFAAQKARTGVQGLLF